MAPRIGRRLRKGATTTAVAAAAVAALSASQGPGVLANGPAGEHAASGTPTPPPGAPASGNSPYYTDLPPLVSPNPPAAPTTGSPVLGADQQGIPATLLDAYKKAEAELARDRASCHLPWQILAAIGKVESGQANGGRVDANGTTLTPILGPVLNGVGFENITDTDGGSYDGDTVHDRAVGPMQFIPSTWATSGRDGNGDGRKDPNNVYDASLAAAYYLCGDRDLAVQSNLDKAVLSYNHSQEYLTTVLTWFDYYKRGSHEVPNGTGVLPGSRSDSPVRRPAGTVPSPHPSTPGPTPKPTPSKPGPKPTPTRPEPSKPTPSDPSSPKPLPSKKASTFEDADTAPLTATAGSSFAGQPKVRVKDQFGRPMGKATVRFQVIGTTGARFPGDATQVTVDTGTDGRATAPALLAGEQTGTFTVRATVVGTSLPEIKWTATVNARQADALARTDAKELTAAPGAEFANYVEVKATYKGAVVPGIAVAAAMIVTPEASAAGTAVADPKVNDKGPYFKDDKGNPIRTLKDLKTDAHGVLRLPKIYADGQTGTFVLRLTTPGGATLDVRLKVA
ncbi:lytic murein transglycosylase [Streptomyces sp. TLI_146]|uniref:lytic transglycosylase domain-containing protein n=1 Tax=Streptomyces sp. TLI_146 TaxID=1938858 RepID=UPI000C7120FB|nr:lytic murein transglycosylase [Streptomyces sp. TLI_146]PKV85165.1 transglycosylase protein with SLT domain [Streptomyces sp. TLI_146]